MIIKTNNKKKQFEQHKVSKETTESCILRRI